MKRLALLLISLTACSGSEPAAKSNDADAKSEPEPDKAEPTKPEVEVAKPEPTKPDAAVIEAANAIPTAPPGEVAIKPWASIPHTATWTLVAEPSEAITFVLELDAGVLGRAGANWFQRGEDGQLGPATMDVEPKPPLVGVWPSDAWFVDRRDKEEGDFTYHELRLMKLRGGDRWVPQVYSGSGEQWFHPGTDHEVVPHMSTLSGMLVYSDEFDSITRVAGKQPDPEIGAHRGTVVEFVESGAGNVYVFSLDAGNYYAQTRCELDDQACVDAHAVKLPLSGFKVERKVARGRHSVSVLVREVIDMSGDGRVFILHHRGKSDGWLLEELPAGERPNGMWASEEGGLWTLTGDRLRWRDTESTWHDVAIPEGMTATSVALTEDRKELWLAGQVAGTTKVFSTPANAAAPVNP